MDNVQAILGRMEFADYMKEIKERLALFNKEAGRNPPPEYKRIERILDSNDWSAIK